MNFQKQIHHRSIRPLSPDITAQKVQQQKEFPIYFHVIHCVYESVMFHDMFHSKILTMSMPLYPLHPLFRLACKF